MRASIILIGCLVAGCGDNIHLVDAKVSDAVVTDAPCTPPATLEAIVSGDLVISSTQVANTVALTVPLDRSILFTSMREIEPSPKFGATICELHDANVAMNVVAGVTCARNNAGTDSASSTGTITVHWTVATFGSGVTVQRGEALTYPVTPNLVTLATPVDRTRSFIVLGGMFNGGSGWGNNEFVRAQLVNGTTLDVRTNVAGTAAAWQVITMSGASVQRGTTSLASSDTQQQVAVTPVSSGVLLASYTTDNVSGIAAATMMLQATVNGNAIAFQRGLAGSALDVSWELITLPFVTHSATTTFAATETVKTEAIAGLSTKSVALATSQAILGQSSGSTSYAGVDLDLVGEAAATLTAVAGAVAVERATSQAATSISWTTIDFSRPRCTGN